MKRCAHARSTLSAGLVLAAAACAPVYADDPAIVPIPRERVNETGDRAADHLDADPGTVAVDRALARVLGSLVWPLAVGRDSVLSSPYGVRIHPVDGASRFHHGLDLRAAAGTPIHAVADGEVTTAARGGAYGTFVVVDHGADLRSLYAHASAALVDVGNRVVRGQPIARVGASGNATGPHLHFELRWRDGTVDPWRVLPALGPSNPRSRRTR